ncbi:MAG: PSD1 and planctomycete cytochrome C domain-containing protein [Pirellulales bacterium]|nr:PSD1 and planctomycete cytochrome C domain-containing protein [Pirellulales bacterium]
MMVATAQSCRTQFFFRAFVLILLATAAASGPLAAQTKVDFQHDIQPILAENCADCHGVDPEARQASLRLDIRAAALAGGDSEEPAIVPQHPELSELIARIFSDDPDVVMPPPATNKQLSQEQKSLLQRWIAEGAEYQPHWAFELPAQAPLDPDFPAHPVDHFVAKKLQAMHLTPSPPANDFTLCRRLFLDLIGIPPTPDELKYFRKHGFAATARALLKDERFGEKWARHWLDVARYSDTNGYEKDVRRDQWAWRDWVIGAYNRDLPYDEFIIEQIAGDLLPGATPAQINATGFLRNSMINEEGAIVPEQFRMFEMFDRMDCIGKAVMGLTTQCAQCHTHKYDPLTHEEYYGMFAFLNNSYEAQSAVYSDDQYLEIAEIMKDIQATEEQIKQRVPDWEAALSEWADRLVAKEVPWSPIVATELGSTSGLNHPTQLPDHSILMLGHVNGEVFMIAQPEASGATALRLEVLPHGDLAYRGPGHSADGTWGLQELEVFVRRPDQTEWEKLKFVAASADFSEPEKKSEDEKIVSGPVQLLIDGSTQTMWKADRGPAHRHQASLAVVQFDGPLDLPPQTEWKVVLRMGAMVGCCRVSWTREPKPTAQAVDYAAVLAAQVPAKERTSAEQASLFAAWRKVLSECDDLNRKIDSLWDGLPSPLTSVLHLARREPEHRRHTYLLERGVWDQPQRPVKPHTPAILHPLPTTEAPDRLTFARWLASDRSPLTARVAVNRIWQAIFGEGLVLTPEDFGTRAPVPEYRDLLDWLSVDLMQNNWSQKQLILRVVTSATYQQSSHTSPELLQRDPRNRLLTRGPRFRCDAEVVRDIALSTAGLLQQQLGGPPIIPPVPQNVLDYNYQYPSYWKPATGPDRYRRALYGFRKRSMPDPVMSAFDGPNGDVACAHRVVSNTPLAALTGLNETIFVEAARALALRVLREGGDADIARADYAFRLCTARTPNAAERTEILNLLSSHRKRLADGWLNPREIATGDTDKLPDLAAAVTPQDLAAWTLVARVLLNLDETISKN